MFLWQFIGFNTMTEIKINIREIQIGDMAQFSYPKNGGRFCQEQGSRFLTVGQSYKVSAVNQHGWHTTVWFYEVDGVGFNSVLFDFSRNDENNEFPEK